mgnify:CR=1 FL=1
MVGNVSLREQIVFISGEGGAEGVRRSGRIKQFSGGIEGGEATPTSPPPRNK